ncbi:MULTISPECIES: class I SAM-dependent methyltransferase [unclassified Mesorhizobium]|uniref:class I SAM-dependent methyltransferase n=1 Tax=unclassified Mesorhizobium TaxID=325217 RepID=UPI001FE0A55B|nr:MULTISPECIES: class I SAM-dependent methyltransferase [unclassified Mesorhizobium]
MFDVLEHIPDPGFLGRLQARHRAVAVPYCRWRELGADAWFRTWRMRLANEHLHHFDRDSLVALLAHSGFDCVTLNGFEDGIRLRPGRWGRIFCLGFLGSGRAVSVRASEGRAGQGLLMRDGFRLRELIGGRKASRS